MAIESSEFGAVSEVQGTAPQGSGTDQIVVSHHSGLPVAFRNGRPDIDHPEKRSSELAIKRAFDIVLSALMIVSLMPWLLLIAVAIALSSPGPIFFVQTREGLLGRSFRIYKFRTVYAKHADATGLRQVEDGDGRVTPIGRILRATAFDELPQLFNILRGDMSLIGPRPHVPAMLAAEQRYDELVPYYALRLLAKPGLSGWAQINGLRGPTHDPDLALKRIDHDIAYVRNFSLLLDLKILLRTMTSLRASRDKSPS